VRYLLGSQYPNGGFPQVYPIEGGYHDAVTLNDDAMLNVVELLGDVAARQGDYAFVPQAVADAARAAVDRSIGLFLATQIKSGGTLTAWGQQYDPLTLAPAGARNFEPASLSTGESAKVLVYLMNLRDPSPDVVRAVHAGAAWLKRAALRDVAWGPGPNDAGRMLMPKPVAGPIWARYYDIATMKPIFGDRDKSIHDDVNEISKERRNGYAWFGTGPAKPLERYEDWAKAHPR
jgi:PelA/Pel-15E family pectate lyase